ncbi:MAG TPA: SPOR domain-containing protein [Flavobacteriales bacterium]|nr:SPOR domain-containing protein [Flavobacteriales bacterium]
MNKTIEHYISELLFLHDCIILPNFGGFVSNPQSVKLNKITGVLTPPSKQILFNTNLKTNDGLLITHISNKEDVSQDLAKNEVENYVAKITEKLNSSKVLRIDKIGLFTLGKEGNIIFLQDSTNNYNLDSFGMKTIHNKAVARETIVEEKVAATIKTIRTHNNSPKTFLRAAAVIIPLVALSYLTISEQNNINSIYTQMASLNPFTPTKVIETANKIEEVVIITPKIIDVEVAPVIISQKTYYIIAGAFAEQKNANKMLAKLNKWNYNATIVEGGNFLRVSYDTFNNKDKAIIALNKIKQENPEAWLLAK